MTLFRFSRTLSFVSLILMALHGAAASPRTSDQTQLRIAVASNFKATLKKLIYAYSKPNQQKILLSSGSTGKLFSQISNGAPFDLFFSADAKKADLLAKERGLTPSHSTIYALGKLVYWSPTLLTNKSEELLTSLPGKTLAIANPKLAPYGYAAQEILEYKNIWRKKNFQLVQGENVIQAYLFAKSGQAQASIISLSLAQESKTGDYWLIPNSLYSPIQQKVVRLNSSSSADRFLKFIASNIGRKIIETSGYGTTSDAH